MRRCFKGFYMSLGMFCAVPLPRTVWGESCMSLLLPCFPLVGIVIGAAWWGLAEAFAALGLNTMLAASLLTAVPFLLTGFLHLDGYMDTSDAVLSRRPLEDRLRILKDPHTGSFAVIMAILLFLLWYGATFAVLQNDRAFILLLSISVLSRCCSSLSMMLLKAMPQSGYGNMLKKDIGKAHIMFTVFAACAAAALSFVFAGFGGLAVSGAVILGYILAMAYVYKDFGGISGDLTGFSLTVSELCGLLALAVVPHTGGIL